MSTEVTVFFITINKIHNPHLTSLEKSHILYGISVNPKAFPFPGHLLCFPSHKIFSLISTSSVPLSCLVHINPDVEHVDIPELKEYVKFCVWKSQLHFSGCSS